MKCQGTFSNIFPFVWAIATVFMTWKALCMITGSTHPIMVVSSESMEPAFHRGDVIVLWNNRQHEISAGDIPVVWFSGSPLPMVHRVIRVVKYNGDDISRQLILTKGDNNEVDDRVLYPHRREFVYRDEVVGLVRGYVPWIGLASLIWKSNPWVPYVVTGGLAAPNILTV